MMNLQHMKTVVFITASLAIWSALVVVINRKELLSEPNYPAAPVLGRRSGSTTVLHQGAGQIADAYLDRTPDALSRARILNDAGNAFLQRNRTKPDSSLLDSAYLCYSASAVALPGQGEVHFTLGRILTDLRRFTQAADHYRRALELDSSIVLALYDLGLLLFSELNRKDSAGIVLRRVIEIAPQLPATNYVLGNLALHSAEFQKSQKYFLREIEIFENDAHSNQVPVPLDSGAVLFAVSESHFHLAVLHSTQFVDASRAQSHYNAFMGMVSDPQRRAAALAEMRKYWNIGNRADGGGKHGQ